MPAEVNPGLMATRRYTAFPHSSSTSSAGRAGGKEPSEGKASSGRSKSPFSRVSSKGGDRGQAKKGASEEDSSKGSSMAARLFGQGGGSAGKGSGRGQAQAAEAAPGPGHSMQRSSSFTGSFSISSPVLVASTVNIQGRGTGDTTRTASTFNGSEFESEQALRSTLSEAQSVKEGQGQGQETDPQAAPHFATGAALLQRALSRGSADPTGVAEDAAAGTGPAREWEEDAPLAEDRGRHNAGSAGLGRATLAKSPRSKRGMGVVGGGKSPTAKVELKKVWHSGPVTSKAALAASGAPAQGQEPVYVRRKKAPAKTDDSLAAHPEPAARAFGGVLFRHKSLNTAEDEDSSELSHSRTPRSPFGGADAGGTGGARGMVERLGQSLRRAGSLGKDADAERKKGRGQRRKGTKSPRRGEGAAGDGASGEGGEEFEQTIKSSQGPSPIAAQLGLAQDTSPPSKSRAWLEESGAPQLVLGKFSSKVVAANSAALAALGFAAEAQAQERTILDLCEGVSRAEWNRAVSSLLAAECKEFPIR